MGTWTEGESKTAFCTGCGKKVRVRATSYGFPSGFCRSCRHG